MHLHFSRCVHLQFHGLKWWISSTIATCQLLSVIGTKFVIHSWQLDICYVVFELKNQESFMSFFGNAFDPWIHVIIIMVSNSECTSISMFFTCIFLWLWSLQDSSQIMFEFQCFLYFLLHLHFVLSFFLYSIMLSLFRHFTAQWPSSLLLLHLVHFFSSLM